MQRPFSFTVEEIYHVYNRGTDKRIIFQDPHDYRRFVVLLYLCNGAIAIDMREHFSEGRSFVDLFQVKRGEKLVDVGAYCLMPNHFHLLLHEATEGGITTFMKKLCTSYSMYFNKKNDRVGPLFQGRFKARHVDNDAYLNYLFPYIHLNPVKLIESEWKEKGISDMQKIKEFINTYPYSSYHDFVGRSRMEGKILNINAFPVDFEIPKDVEKGLNEVLAFEENCLKGNNRVVNNK